MILTWGHDVTLELDMSRISIGAIAHAGAHAFNDFASNS